MDIEPAKVDADRGIYPKYVVFRHPDFEPDELFAEASQGGHTISNTVRLDEVTDFTFTLRPSKDYHARVALAAYAESVRHWNPTLAEDIDDALDNVQSEPPRMEPT